MNRAARYEEQASVLGAAERPAGDRAGGGGRGGGRERGGVGRQLSLQGRHRVLLRMTTEQGEVKEARLLFISALFGL